MAEEKSLNQKYSRVFIIVGILCAAIAMIAIFLSFYFSGDKTQLYKLGIPAMILIILAFCNKKNKHLN